MRRGSVSGMVLIAACALTTQAAAQGKPTQASRIEALERALQQQAAEMEALRGELTRQKEEAERPPPEPPPPPEPEPTAEEQAALAALLAESQAETDSMMSEGPNLRLYGFADMGLQKVWVDKPLELAASDTQALTFVLGNVNLYLDAQVSPNWRFLAEVRFWLGPNGATARPAGGYGGTDLVDTTISDPTAANGLFASVRWAGVIPQRAHIDWTPRDWFNLRAGLFLTPYGIWNVDHGTPTRIMASEPAFLSQSLFPNQLVGVEMFGTLPQLPWTFGYHAYVSNGRTSGQVDLTDNKAVGGRLFVSTRNPHAMKFGVSGYWGTYDRDTRSIGTREVIMHYKEYAVSADASLDIGKLRLRSELAASWTIYEDGKRQSFYGLTFADNTRVGGYAMAAYQLPWWGLEPLLMLEYLRYPIPRALPVGSGLIMPAVGLNAYFTATTMLRSQFSLGHGVDMFGADPVDTKGFLYQAVLRLVTAF